MATAGPLFDPLFRDKVLAARRRSPESKFFAGGELFEYALQNMRLGILAQNPSATEDQIRTEIRRRLAISRALEKRP